MKNVEQRINMYHLVSRVLAYGIGGDFVCDLDVTPANRLCFEEQGLRL